MQHYLNAGNRVITVDYVWDPSTPSVALHDDFHARCITEGLIPYTGVSDRDLDEILVIGAGQGAVHEQPKVNSGVIFTDGFESGDTSAW